MSFPSPNSEFEVSQVLVFKLLLQEKSTRRQHFLWPHLSSSGNQSPRENLFQSCLVTSSPLTCTPRRNPKPSPNCDAECAVVLRWEDCQEGGCWWEPHHWGCWRTGDFFKIPAQRVGIVWEHWVCLSGRRAHLDMEIGVPSIGTRHFRLKGAYLLAHPPQLQPSPALGLRVAQAPRMWHQARGPRPIPLAFIFLIFVLYWSNIDIQCCVSSQHTSTWFSYTYAYINSSSDSLPTHLTAVCWVEFRLLYKWSWLIYYCVYVNFSLLIYASLPPHLAPWAAVCFLHLWFCFCFANECMCIDSEVVADSDTIAILSLLVWLPSLRMITSRSTHVAGIGIFSTLFYSWGIFHCICVPLLYLFISGWRFSLLPPLGFCQQCSSEHLHACANSSYGFCFHMGLGVVMWYFFC